MAIKDLIGPGFVGTGTVKFIVTRGLSPAYAPVSVDASVGLSAGIGMSPQARYVAQVLLALGVGLRIRPTTTFGVVEVFTLDIADESVLVGGRDSVSQADPFEIKVNELTSFQYTGLIVDPSNLDVEGDPTPIPGSSLATLTLTLYNAADGTIINSRDNQNVLNANDVTVSEGGVLVWNSLMVDSPIVDSAGIGYYKREVHIALFEFTFPIGDPTKGANIEVRIFVRNLKKVS